MTQAFLATGVEAQVPRAIGGMILSAKASGGRSAIDRFRTSGATKVAFPRRTGVVEAIMINTSGGLTGGDRLTATATAGTGSRMVLTTQAAERAYRSLSGTARVRTRLQADPGAVLHWLPQEMIVFDGAALDRQLEVDLDADAELVLVEPIIFGRTAMGETLNTGSLRDSIEIRREGETIYRDRIHLTGPVGRALTRPALAGANAALATAVYVGPRARAVIDRVRQLLPETGGASLLRPDLLNIRLLAADCFLLRRALIPVLEQLTGAQLPKSWSL